MKKNLLFTLVLFLASCTFVSAQKYNEQDKEGLRAFLRQPSPIEGKLNLEEAKLVISDTTNWTISEEWVAKIYKNSGTQCINWSNDTPKRLIHLSPGWTGGTLDCRLFTELETFSSPYHISSVNLSGCSKLKKISNLHQGYAESVDISGCSELEEVHFGGWELKNVNITGCIKLNKLYLESNSSGKKNIIGLETALNLVELKLSDDYISELNLSKYPNLEILRLTTPNLVSLNLQQNLKIRSLTLSQSNLQYISLLSNSQIEYINFYRNNNLKSVSLAGLRKLEEIHCDDNNSLASLNIQNCPNLHLLQCNNNKLTTLNLFSCPNVNQLSCSGNTLTTLNLLGCPNLIKLSCNSNNITDIDLKPCPLLESIECTNNKITSLNLIDQDNLTSIVCYNNEISNLVLPYNTTILQYIYCNNNMLRSLDLSKYSNLSDIDCMSNKLEKLELPRFKVPSLSTIMCSGNKLTSLDYDFSNYPNLWALICNDNKLKHLDLSTNVQLIKIECENNELETLQVAGTPYYLFVEGNNLKFSSLPLMSIATWCYFFSSQKIIDGGETYVSSIIDLSSEYRIKENITIYTWYDQSGERIALTDNDEGLFVAEQAYEGQTLTCKMTNKTFPDLILEYQVKIVGAALQDHMQMNVNNNYVLSKNQQFKVSANVSGIDADEVHFGLCAVSDASYIKDITVVSRKNSTYTCEVPSNTYNGSYMIVPYTYKDGKRVVINRAVATHFIDRLPLKVIDNDDNDIWGRSTKSYIPNQDITAQYMRANIGGKVNELLEVEQDASFMINIGTSSPENVRIGLFHLNGKFVTDITTKVNKSTYTCMVSGQPANTYLVMPYIKQNGVVEVVEREAKSGLMDRLPICVGEEDIWGRGAASFEVPATETDIIVYLNNTTNVVEIKGVDEVVNVEIYSLATGTLAKKAKVAASEGVSVQTLATGIYIVKVTTATGDATSHKIKKD